MGEILEAEHVALRRKVIVKVVHRAYATLPGYADRFRLEAQSLATLAPKTAHIVAVLDFGVTSDGVPFLVLEHLAGRTLEREIQARGVLPPFEAVQLARELLDALRCAHEVGIIHRDVKPENIFLAEPERGGRVLKLLDFGIAKVLPGASDEDAPAPLALPTEEGVTLGTPRFLSPEQARGRPADHRSDLYSVGAVVYAMLTGRDPFAHVEGVGAVLLAHAVEPPQAPSVVAAQPISERLDRVVLKALAKQPEDRFASATEFADALELALAPPALLVGGGTERMDTSVFQRARRLALPDNTEPIDVHVFHGVRRDQRAAQPRDTAPAPSPWPSTVATPKVAASSGGPATQAPMALADAAPSSAALMPSLPADGQPRGRALIMGLLALVFAVAVVLALVFVARLR
jgi:serine/threonine-protein kinase